MGEVTYNPPEEDHKCTCLPLNMTVSFLRKSKTKPIHKTKFQELEKKRVSGLQRNCNCN